MNPTQARPSDTGIQSSSIPFYGRLFHSLSEGVSCVATVLSAKSFCSTFCIVGQFHMRYLCFYLALPFWDCLFYPSFIWVGFSGHWAQFLFNFALKICTTAQMFFPKKKKKRNYYHYYLAVSYMCWCGFPTLENNYQEFSFLTVL